LASVEHDEQTVEPEVAPAPPAHAPAAAPVRVPAAGVGPTHVLSLLAAEPPPVRAAHMGQLQRSAGNRAVARAVLARAGEGGAGPGSATPHGGQHGAGPTLDPLTLTDPEKIEALPGAIAGGEKDTVYGLWTSHGGWPGIARSHEELFLQSAKLSPDLLDAFTDERESFKRSVEGRAKNHLSANKQYVMEEMAKLGIEVEASFDAGTPEDQARRVGEVKALAVEAQRALRAKQDLLGIKVGYNGSQVDQGASGAPAAYQVVSFDPDNKPQQPGEADQGFRTWEEVNAQWTDLEGTIVNMESTSPALFAIINQDTLETDSAKAEEAGALAADDDVAARSKMEAALKKLQTKLDEVHAGVGSEYEWDDLGLLYPQVLGEDRWAKPIDNAIANKLIKDETESDAAIDTALTAVGIVAALVGVFATGGMALALTAVGAAASGAQAVKSVDDYARKQAMREARTGHKQHDLIGKEETDAARIKALLDTIFAFIDLAGAAKAIRAAGAAEDVVSEVRRLGQLAPAKKETAFKTALDVMGPPKALDAVGGLEAARGQLGAGSSAMKRAQAYSDELVEEMGQSLGGRQARERAAKAVGPDAVPAPPAAGTSPGAALPPAPPVKPPEDLLKQAQDFAAAKTGLPADRALKTVAPAADSLDEIAQVIQRGAAASAEMSEEFATLATKEARAAKVHERAVAWAQQRRVPAARSSLADNGPFFDAKKWEVVYNSADLEAKEATNATWEILQGTGVHEMRHAQQYVDMARVGLGRGMSEAEMVAQLGIHADGVKAARELGPLRLGDRGFEQADEWFQSFYGTGREYRDEVLAELAKHRGMTRRTMDAANKVEALQEKLKGLAADSPERAALQRQLKEAEFRYRAQYNIWERNRAAREANHSAYKSLPEEADAYTVEAEYEAMLQAKREADAAAQRAAEEELANRPTGEFTPYREPEEIELDDSDIIEVTTP